MRVALLIAPKDFKDESVSNIKMMLEKWDIETVITSYATHDCVGYHGAVYTPDLNAAKVVPSDYDALVLIDGKGVDSYKLYDFRPLLDLVKLFQMKGKLICSIGNATKIVARANVIAQTKIAMPSDEEARRLIILYHGTPSKEEMESDKNIMTLSSSDKALGFADMILGKLGVK